VREILWKRTACAQGGGYYEEHEMVRTLVILNKGPQAQVKDLVFRRNCRNL